MDYYMSLSCPKCGSGTCHFDWPHRHAGVALGYISNRRNITSRPCTSCGHQMKFRLSMEEAEYFTTLTSDGGSCSTGAMCSVSWVEFYPDPISIFDWAHTCPDRRILVYKTDSPDVQHVRVSNQTLAESSYGDIGEAWRLVGQAYNTGKASV